MGCHTHDGADELGLGDGGVADHEHVDVATEMGAVGEVLLVAAQQLQDQRDTRWGSIDKHGAARVCVPQQSGRSRFTLQPLLWFLIDATILVGGAAHSEGSSELGRRS